MTSAAESRTAPEQSSPVELRAKGSELDYILYERRLDLVASARIFAGARILYCATDRCEPREKREGPSLRPEGAVAETNPTYSGFRCLPHRIFHPGFPGVRLTRIGRKSNFYKVVF